MDSPPIAFELLVPAAQMTGEDEEETALLKEMLAEATAFLEGHRWCRKAAPGWWGWGVGGVFSVFLFEIDGDPGVDPFLWVVVGDLPSAYFEPFEAPTAIEALDTYCDLMDLWIEAVESGRDLTEVFPVAAEPTRENACALRHRLATVRNEIRPQMELRLDDRKSG